MLLRPPPHLAKSRWGLVAGIVLPLRRTDNYFRQGAAWMAGESACIAGGSAAS